MTVPRRQPFRRADLPWTDIARAARLGRDALALLLLTHWQLAHVPGPVLEISDALLADAELDIGPRELDRALRALDAAGLLRIEPDRRAPRVALARKRRPSSSTPGSLDRP